PRAAVRERSPSSREAPPVKLAALFGACGIAVPEGAADADVRKLAYDSRKVEPGSVFVAIAGFHRDGHEFIADATKRGAIALVAGGTWGVLEATSHALALRKVRGCEIDVAVFTNLSPEHLDFHGSLQGYLDAKAILFTMLGSSAEKGVVKTAVLNADDPHWSY